MVYSQLIDIFSRIADFFSRFGFLAFNVTAGEFFSLLDGSISSIPFTYVNIVTGQAVVYNLTVHPVINALAFLLKPFQLVLPASVFSQPLIIGLLLASVEWLLIVSIIKFFTGIIFGG